MGGGVTGPQGADAPPRRAAVEREIADQIEQLVLCLLVGQTAVGGSADHAVLVENEHRVAEGLRRGVVALRSERSEPSAAASPEILGVV